MYTHQIKAARPAKELMADNMIVKHYAGSISYGTNLPTSDVDFRGVFCGDPINILAPFHPIKECEDQDEEDTKLFELRHFFKLCVDCNPNIIETLWVDESDIIFTTDAYHYIRQYREEMLSQKIAHTTSGYAFSQLKRIKGHNKWINNPQSDQPPVPKDFVSMVQYFGKDKMLKFNIDDWNVDHQFGHYGNDIYGIYEGKGRRLYDKFGKLNTDIPISREELGLPKLIVKYNKSVFKEHLQNNEQYWSWKKNRNKSRSVLEEEFGYDTKHAMHLVRLLRMGKEVLETGKIIVKRPDAEELLAIRNGSMTYEEIVEYAEDMDNDIKTNLLKNTDLQKKVNKVRVAEILMTAQDAIWSSNAK